MGDQAGTRSQLTEDARRIAEELRNELVGGGDRSKSKGRSSGDRTSKSRTRSSKKTKKKKRRRSSSSSSSSQEDSRRRKKHVPTSQKIKRDQWPEGYDTEGMDDLSFLEAHAIMDREDKVRKRDRDSLPGVRVARKETKLKLVKVPEGLDDGSENLHVARYYNCWYSVEGSSSFGGEEFPSTVIFRF